MKFLYFVFFGQPSLFLFKFYLRSLPDILGFSFSSAAIVGPALVQMFPCPVVTFPLSHHLTFKFSQMVFLLFSTLLSVPPGWAALTGTLLPSECALQEGFSLQPQAPAALRAKLPGSKAAADCLAIMAHPKATQYGDWRQSENKSAAEHGLFTSNILDALHFGKPFTILDLPATRKIRGFYLLFLYLINTGTVASTGHQACLLHQNKTALTLTFTDCLANIRQLATKFGFDSSELPSTQSSIPLDFSILTLDTTTDTPKLKFLSVTSKVKQTFVALPDRAAPLLLHSHMQLLSTCKEIVSLVLQTSELIDPALSRSSLRLQLACAASDISNCQPDNPTVQTFLRPLQDISSRPKRSIIGNILFDTQSEVDSLATGHNILRKNIGSLYKNEKSFQLFQRKTAAVLSAQTANLSQIADFIIQAELDRHLSSFFSSLRNDKLERSVLAAADAQNTIFLQQNLLSDLRSTLNMLFHHNPGCGFTNDFRLFCSDSADTFLIRHNQSYFSLGEGSLMHSTQVFLLQCLPNAGKIFKYNHRLLKNDSDTFFSFSDIIVPKSCILKKSGDCEEFFVSATAEHTARIPQFQQMFYVITEDAVHFVAATSATVNILDKNRVRIRVSQSPVSVALSDFPLTIQQSPVDFHDLYMVAREQTNIHSHLKADPLAKWQDHFAIRSPDTFFDFPDVDLENIQTLFQSSAIFRNISITGSVFLSLISLSCIACCIYCCCKSGCVCRRPGCPPCLSCCNTSPRPRTDSPNPQRYAALRDYVQRRRNQRAGPPPS